MKCSCGVYRCKDATGGGRLLSRKDWRLHCKAQSRSASRQEPNLLDHEARLLKIEQELNHYILNPPTLDQLAFNHSVLCSGIIDVTNLASLLDSESEIASKANASLYQYDNWYSESSHLMTAMMQENDELAERAKSIHTKLSTYHRSMQIKLEATAHLHQQTTTDIAQSNTPVQVDRFRLFQTEIAVGIQKYKFPPLIFNGDLTLSKSYTISNHELLSHLHPANDATNETLSQLRWLQSILSMLQSAPHPFISSDRLLDFVKGLEEHRSNVFIHLRAQYLKDQLPRTSIIPCLTSTYIVL
jgi:hypothetical protein